MSAGLVKLLGSYQKPWIYPLKPAECIILKKKKKKQIKKRKGNNKEKTIFIVLPLSTFLLIDMLLFSADPSHVPWRSTIFEAIDLYN
jgi:hypothetical protein